MAPIRNISTLSCSLTTPFSGQIGTEITKPDDIEPGDIISYPAPGDALASQRYKALSTGTLTAGLIYVLVLPELYNEADCKSDLLKINPHAVIKAQIVRDSDNYYWRDEPRNNPFRRFL